MCGLRGMIKYLYILTLLYHVVFCNSDTANTHGKSKGNILCLMTIASPSHHIWNRALMEALAMKGYNITALSIDVDKKPVENLHYIHVEGVYETLYEKENLDLMEFAAQDIFGNIRELTKYFSVSAKATLESKGFQTLLNYPDNFKFDLVVYDFAAIPAALGFLHKFGYPPLVGVTAFMKPPNTMDATGSPLFASLVPYFGSALSPEMTFWQRTLNVYYYVLDTKSRRGTMRDLHSLAEKVFGKGLPSLADLEKKMDVALVNVHSSIDIPEPLLPAVIPVGGLQIKEPKILPEALTKFIESSKKGTVLFSLGSNLKSALLGEERIQKFLSAFSQFPDYHFLWKFEEDGLKTPKNVMVQKWMSQNDILAHPKLILFMTHCGLLSTQESTWHGVPMLGIPFLCDQHSNCHKALEAGVAEKLDVFNLSVDGIVAVLKRMLEDPSYQRAMSVRSRLFRDRPRHPLQEAVWWCEYVLRNKGARHLRSAAASMSPFVLFMWDLLLVWSSILVLVLFVSYAMLKKLLCSKTDYSKTSEALRQKKQK